MSRAHSVYSTKVPGPLFRRRPSHAAPSKAAAATRGKALLETHLELIQRKLQRLSWRSGLPAFEAEEFRSWAIFKLVDDDYRILGRWEGRSSFSTYLTVVLVNLMRDYRIHVWGKWRPSAASRRLGQKGVLLERFLVRDGLTGDEAAERLQTELGISVAPDEMVSLAATFPQRQERRRESEEELAKIPIDGQVESRVEEEERARIADRLHELLVPLLRSLPAEDRLLLKMHFFDGFSMASLAPILRRPQRELYTVRDRCLKRLRRALETAGLGADQIRELLDRFQGSINLEAHLRA
jgi:RNA polymerase sigma factor (sigma-70 family)